MERWNNQIAIVTGATAGIGAAIVENLVNHDIKVVGLSRRKERLDALSEKYGNKKFYGIKTDIRNEEEILNAFKWVKENLGPISILINCAGLIKNITLINGSTSDFQNTLDTNVLGLTIATREAVQDMIANNIDGHIIHINSTDGHYVPHVPHMNIYAASKFAVTALTETLRQELNAIERKIKITSVSPGMVDTEIFTANGYDDDKEACKQLNELPYLQPKDVADAVVYALSTPPHAMVTELTIRPVGEPF